MFLHARSDRMDISGMNIVSIDDNTSNLLIIEAYAQVLGLHVKSFTNPIEALNYLKNTECDMLITDYMMPQMNGIELVKAFREQDKQTPIVMVTAVGDNVALHIEALEAGVTDFLSKPIHTVMFKARLTNLLQLKKAQRMIENRAFLLEEEVKKATASLLAREHETLQILGKTAEYKDPETGAHVARVAHYSRLLARAMGQNERFQDIIFYASPFHDIGKVGIPDAILLKEGKLSEIEFTLMKQHANIGHEILKASKSEYLKAGAVIAFSHHEKFNGLGYPSGLKGTMIPLMGRIVAVADVFDALTSARPYKGPWSFEKAFAFLNEESGGHFDPDVVKCFIAHHDEVKSIYEQFQGEEI